MISFALLSVIALGAPGDVERLAPTVADLQSELAELDARLAEARALGEAVGALHARYASVVPATGGWACELPDAASVSARSLVFGEAYRLAVQASRAQLGRVQPMLAEPTLVPLLSDADRDRVQELSRAVADHVKWYGEMSAWHLRFVAPRVGGCGVTLAPAPGLATGLPLAREDEGKPVAVAAIGGGLLCPAGLPADGRVVVLADARACYAAGAECTCDPVPVQAGAVVGP